MSASAAPKPEETLRERALRRLGEALRMAVEAVLELVEAVLELAVEEEMAAAGPRAAGAGGRYIRVSEAAKELGVSPTTVYAQVQARRLKAVNVGTRVCIPRRGVRGVQAEEDAVRGPTPLPAQ
jgi:excisionase family DNA binding protein